MSSMNSKLSCEGDTKSLPQDFNELVGLRSEGLINGQYVITLELESHHLNVMGGAHGGLICTLLDTVMARSYLRTAEQEKDGSQSLGVTTEFKVNFLKAVKSGKLVAYGQVIYRGRSLAYVEGYVENASGAMVAKATGSILLLEPSPKKEIT